MGVSTQSTWGSHLHTISIFLNQLHTKHTSNNSTSNQSSCLTQHARDSASRPRRSSLLKARSPPDKPSVRTSLVLEIRLLPQSSQAARSQPPRRLVTASEAPATVLHHWPDQGHRQEERLVDFPTVTLLRPSHMDDG